MLHRNKKQNDPNKGKWVGVGGKIEKGESVEECLLREVTEETGLTLTEFQYRGKIYFYSNIYNSEIMYLYTATEYTGDLIESNEGKLAWIDKSNVLDLNLWEGDKIFLNKILEGDTNTFIMHLYYEGDKLVKVIEEA